MPVHLPETKMGFPTDFEYCHQVIKEGSKSFHLASLMLPKPVRRAAFAVYAFCRIADDEIDLGADPARAVETLMGRLDRIYAGTPDNDPIDRAFACVVSTYALPRALPDGLLEGMSWDVQNRRYETLDALMEYAARVAGTVGAMMTVLMGNRSITAVARASDLGMAMQLTNIARDIGEDARAGRLYAPGDWLRDEGLDPEEFLANPVFEPRIARVTQRLIETAAPIYEQGLSGVCLLPTRCRTSIRAAGSIYREIGNKVCKNGYDSITQRAVVSKARKVQLLTEAAFEGTVAQDEGAPMPASGFLVEAVASMPKRINTPVLPSRALWVIDLFTRLEMRDQMRRGQGE
jgi:phytoene synthase